MLLPFNVDAVGLLTDHFNEKQKPLYFSDLHENIEVELGAVVALRGRIITAGDFRDYVLASLELTGYTEDNKCSLSEWFEMRDSKMLNPIVEASFDFIQNELSEGIGYEFPIQKYFYNLLDAKSGGITIRSSETINNNPSALLKVKVLNDLILTIASHLDQSENVKNGSYAGGNQQSLLTGITFGSLVASAGMVDSILKAYPINQLIEQK